LSASIVLAPLPAGHHLDERVEVDAGCAPHDQRLRERARVRGGDGVVDELDDLAVPERPDVDDDLAHDLEERAGTRHVLLGAADHDRQRAVLRLGRGARDWGVDEAQAALGERRSDRTGLRGRDRRHVDAEHARRRRPRPRRRGPRRTCST
jgi:hypothetical protein